MDTNAIAGIGTDSIVILIAFVGVGIALGGLILRQGARLDRRIDALQEQIDRRFEAAHQQTTDLRQEIDRRFEAAHQQTTDLRQEMNHRFDAAQEQTNDLRERVARIEGILTRRTAAAEKALETAEG